MNTSSPRRTLFAAYDARRTGRLRVSDLHEIYFEEAGMPDGVPVIGLHGGPGGGSSPEMRRFFDRNRYRVILADQRGCGRSTPASELAENDTWELVKDVEKLRIELGIDKWIVFGGSWGSTLALAYAVTYPERVLGLILRGIFLATESEIRWFYQEGASRLFPDSYDRYTAPVTAFHKRLTSDDPETRLTAARAWACWEGETITMRATGRPPPRFGDDRFVDAFARIENHFFVNKGFFPYDGWLLDQVKAKIQHIPGVIVHGRYDVVTPLSTAWELKKVWPKSQLHIIPDAGHSSMEQGIIHQLITATERFADVFEAEIL